MSYAYGAYGPYAPYGAYGALSPYDVNALGLVQAYRAMGTKTDDAPGDRSASKENAAPTVVSSGSGSMNIDAIKKLIKENVDTLQQTCQGCPPEYKARFERVEKRLVDISNELKAGKLSPELVANLEKIVNDIQSLQTQSVTDYNNLKAHVDTSLEDAIKHLHDEAQTASRQLEYRLKLQNQQQNIEFRQERHASEQEFQQSIADILKRIGDIENDIFQAKESASSSEISQELLRRIELTVEGIQRTHGDIVETQNLLRTDLTGVETRLDDGGMQFKEEFKEELDRMRNEIDALKKDKYCNYLDLKKGDVSNFQREWYITNKISPDDPNLTNRLVEYYQRIIHRTIPSPVDLNDIFNVETIIQRRKQIDLFKTDVEISQITDGLIDGINYPCQLVQFLRHFTADGRLFIQQRN